MAFVVLLSIALMSTAHWAATWEIFAKKRESERSCIRKTAFIGINVEFEANRSDTITSTSTGNNVGELWTVFVNIILFINICKYNNKPSLECETWLEHPSNLCRSGFFSLCIESNAQFFCYFCYAQNTQKDRPLNAIDRSRRIAKRILNFIWSAHTGCVSVWLQHVWMPIELLFHVSCRAKSCPSYAKAI